MTKPEQHIPTVRMVNPPEPVPVFSCQVIVTPGASGVPWRGRCANYVGINVSGPSERAVLQQIVNEFKSVAAAKLALHEELDSITPPEQPAAGEQLRFIAVHL